MVKLVTMIERECPVCGKVYKADPGRLKHGRQTTCSRKCSYEWRAQKKRKAVELECPVCGEAFERAPSQIERTKYTNVCSLDCLYEGRSLGIIEREVTEPYELTDEGREAMRQAGIERRGKYKKPPVKWTCETCGKVSKIDRGDISPARQFRFCSNECANIGLRGEGNPSWRGGYEPYYGPNWRAQRRKARKRDNYTCQECGISQDELGRKLDVHHIIRFADFDSYKQANKLDNLISYCHTCHMVVEWRDCR